MRDIILVLAILGGLGVTLRYPFAGVLLWTWFTCQNPHQEAFGFARSLPLNLIIVAVTVVAMLFSKERKWPQMNLTFGLLLAFLVWMTVASFFAVNPAFSWPFWDRTWRVLVLALLVGALATNKVRIHAIIWVIAASLMYFGVKGGIFTLMTGGHYLVLGPENSIIRDNNQLALALLMAMPLVNYLRQNSQNWWLRTGLAVALGLMFMSVVGSYSRGAYLAIAALAVVAWWRSRNRLLYPVLVAAVAIPALFFMPQSFYDRLDSINSVDTDASFQGRLTAWQVAYRAAVDHFPFGVGFNGAQRPEVYNVYFPGQITHAAHSIYFEVLGDIGFIGLGIYLSIIALLFWHCMKIMRATRDRPELFWARDLAGMIQLSLFAFCIGGAALSMAYYDVFVLYIGVLAVLRPLTTAPVPARRPAMDSGQLAHAR
jgi:probable O-glycosylation ligase (exosortase A-associated)